MTKILITGGAGYIGSHTVTYMINQGYPPEEIVVIDNLVNGYREFIPPRVNFFHGDIRNPLDLLQLFRRFEIGGVIHFAGYAYVGESMLQPGKYFENNLLGGLHLLEAMVASGCKNIVFSSSCATYGIPSAIPINEGFPTIPINPYGESKLAFEKMLRWYAEIHDIRSISLRYFNAAGAGFGIGERHDPETHLIPLVCLAAIGLRKPFLIFGNNYETPDGTCIRDYIHVLDLADAHIRAIKFLEQTSATVAEIFNLGTGRGTSVAEIVLLVQKIARQDVPYQIAPRRLGDPAELVANPQKAKSVLGWSTQRGIELILEDAWRWHRQS